MFNPNSQDRLTQYFLEEVTELLDTIEQNLYGLLEEKTTDKVHTLMRSAHTIKGSAANMELKTIETIAHHLEDVFESLYAEDLTIDPELGSLLLDGYECLRNPLTATLSGSEYDEEEALDRTATVFANLQEKLGDFFGREAPIPSSEELGFDVVGSIFTDSIPQDLQDLEQVIGTQDSNQILDKLVSVAQFLQNIGLSYNLPGLTAIAEASLAAIEKNTDDIISVAIVALENFYQAQNTIVSGDRGVGGEISPQLQELAAIGASETITATPEEPIPDLTEYSAVAEQAISESTAMVEAVTETESTNPSPSVPNTATEPSSEDSESEGVEEESDSQIFAALFSENNHHKAKVPEVLAPATDKKPISPIDRILQSIWIAKPEQTIEFTPTSTESSKAQNAESQGSIRVAVEQLENLSQAMGELLIDDNLQTLQTEQFYNSTREALQQHRSCQQQLNEIYDWWDKQFLRSRHRRRRMSRNSSQRSMSASLEHNSQGQKFDPLEMDVYSDLHILLQGFNEKITELGEKIETIEKFASESRFNTVKRKQALSQAQDNLLNARMVSLAIVLERFPRMLKQMVASHKKPAELALKGGEIQIDKAISDKLYEPLLHLVRNAYDHGLEDADTRREQNKPATGTITIRAYNQGNRTFIEIEDDGRGLNWQRIRAKAVDKGILSPLDAEQASQARLAEILFQSGFSTADSVSELSGRGVGLDVVRNQIENLGGRISLDSQTGKGTKFTLQLPLKLTTSRLLICQAQGMVYGILSDTIIRIIVPQADQITTQASAIGQGEQTFLRWEEDEQKTLIPIADISSSITYQYPLLERSTNSILKTFPIKKAYRVPPLLLLQNQGEYICLKVEEIIVEQELVIKSLGSIIDLPDYIQGYTVLGDGSFTLVIEPHLLLSQGWKDISSYSSNVRAITPTLPAVAEQPQSILPQDNSIPTEIKQKLLVIEDSVFQRQSLVNTLEKFDYEVVEASNGQEAIEKLQQNKDITLIISDIEMPTMNGFEFLSHKQKDPTISQIPVIMITTRSSQKHRQLAFSLGANEYHTKPYSDSELLNSINQLTGNSQQLTVNSR